MAELPVAPPDLAPARTDASFAMWDYGLYGIIVAVWGVSWIGIKLQLGTVDPIVSVAWRFWLAAAAMFIWVLVSRRAARFDLRTHVMFVGLGIFLFSSNFVFFYYAGYYMVSGLLAVIFSIASVVNVINSLIFLGESPRLKVVVAAMMGAGGLALIFAPSIGAHGFDSEVLAGLGLALCGTLSFSFGNMISVKVQRAGLPLVSSNAYGMLYGAIFMSLLAVATGKTFAFEMTARYVGSLLYLSLGATVVAFASYLTLLRRVGASRAAYVTVLFPLVALAISTVVEGYQWNVSALAGLALVLAGNVLIIRR